MQNYEFKLTPAYCLYNGAAVYEQDGAKIKFIIEGGENSVLKKRLEKAFLNHVSYVLRQEDCDSSFKVLPEVEFISGSHEEVRNCITRLFHEDNSNQKSKEEKKRSENEAAAILLLDSVLDESRKKNVTDIHIESCYIRFRINGKLVDYASIQKERNDELLIRIKLLAGLNVLEKRESQNGQFVYGDANPVFVRVSIIPVTGGSTENSEESVVMRLLDTTRVPLGLSHLGFSDRQLISIGNLMDHRNGLILVCGATGCGKSTTAASMLMDIVRFASGSKKIISMEDPPEYVIPGVTQIKINEKSGMTYDSALEDIFRQDPDVIMIGEIRNENGARTALRAAMTGHLVIATLHTDSASSSVYRLMDLGCSEKILASVLRGVIIQELEHEDEEVVLMADVCSVSNSFEKVVCSVEKMNSEIIEDAFIHVTNVPELLVKTGRRLTNKYIQAESSDSKKAEYV